jgi:steroid delta-isomerase-like uncharacterized protein
VGLRLLSRTALTAQDRHHIWVTRFTPVEVGKGRPARFFTWGRRVAACNRSTPRLAVRHDVAMTGSSTTNKEVVRRHLEDAWNDHHPELWNELLDQNLVIHHPQMPPGREAYVQGCDVYWAAFPDAHTEILDLIAEGDRVVARWVERGTHKGEFMGVPPTGRTYEKQGISIYRVQDGRLAEVWLQEDASTQMFG